ncbi:MAG TPA: NAD(+) diphosphatase [Actinotalea sp.]|nr:NAD(+) diphosphatase [Actinotalea sp.]
MDWTRLPLSRAAVDRAAHRRGPAVLESAWLRPDTQVLLVVGGLLATRSDGDAVRLDLRSPASLPGLGPAVRDGELPTPDPTSGAGRLVLFLGEDPRGAAFLALVVDDVAALAPSGLDLVDADSLDPSWGEEARTTGPQWSNLRDVGHLLSDRDAGLAATAVGLAAWHERHPRCARCGAPTVPDQAGWTRRCTLDGSDHYPRTDPAVIMAVLDDDDRLLLGHAAHWPERRFSTLAGYVEPGESAESAVRREVREEVGVRIGDMVYRGSQPWPFPASLMLAFVARATSTELTVDGVEVTAARWFTRGELAADVRTGEVLLPMRTSVARVLIEEWFGGPLGRPPG